MKFYFNIDQNVCADEEWVIGYIIINDLNSPQLEHHQEIRELARAQLRSKREYNGWFECQVSNTIEEKFM